MAFSRHLLLHHRIGVAIFDAVRDAETRQKLRQHMLGKVRLALVEIAGEKIDREQTAVLQVEKKCQEGIGILATRNPDQPPRAGLDHVVHRDGLAHLAQQPLAELLEADRAGCLSKEQVASVRLFDAFVGCQWRPRRIGVAHPVARARFRARGSGAARFGGVRNARGGDPFGMAAMQCFVQHRGLCCVESHDPSCAQIAPHRNSPASRRRGRTRKIVRGPA